MTAATKVTPIRPTFAIETHVPPPAQHGATKHGALSDALRALAAAPVGASIYFPPGMDMNTVRPIATRIIGKGCFATRKEGDGYRVWKTGERG
jgi:hypothetical protein